MKPLLYLLLTCLSTGCVQPQIADEEFPLDSLLHYANGDELRAMWVNTITNSPNHRTVFWTFSQEVELYWLDGDHVPPMRVVVHPQPYHSYDPLKYPTLPRHWKTRAGLYVEMSLDSLQALNGKPFLLYAFDSTFMVKNWNGGKLDGTNTEFVFWGAYDGAPAIVSSQEVIDQNGNLSSSMMILWAAGVKENANTPGVIPGRYSEGTARLLTRADVQGYELAELGLMRNEIFARHGMVFKSEELKTHFEGMPWYEPLFIDVTDKLTETEKTNIAFIVAREESISKYGFRAVLMKELPQLSLPLNLENLSITGVTLSPVTEPPSGQRGNMQYERTVYGLLPDTSRFYCILWLGPQDLSPYPPINDLFVTTFDKNFNPIATAGVQLPGGPLEQGSDCQSHATVKSMLNPDFTYNSTSETVRICDDDTVRYTSVISGRINADGTIKQN